MANIGPIYDSPVVTLVGSEGPIYDGSASAIPYSIGPVYESVIYPPPPPPLLRTDQTSISLIAVLRSADMNSVLDQPIALGTKRYVVRRVVVCGASTSLTTAVGGIYTSPGKTGTALVPSNQAYTSLTGPTKFLDTALHASMGTDVVVSETVYLSLTTPQGIAATADVYIYGDSVES